MGYKKHFDRFDDFICQILVFGFKPLRKTETENQSVAGVSYHFPHNRCRLSTGFRFLFCRIIQQHKLMHAAFANRLPREYKSLVPICNRYLFVENKKHFSFIYFITITSNIPFSTA